MERAVPQVEVDGVLVRHGQFCCEPLEIGHRRFVQTNGDGLLQSGAVRISLSMVSLPVLCGLLASSNDTPCVLDVPAALGLFPLETEIVHLDT